MFSIIGRTRLDMFLTSVILLLLSLPAICTAQFAPYWPLNVTKIYSPVDPGISITYKVPDGACNTAFSTQQQYTGWVNVPGAYETNIFFWFIGARQPTSQLTIWLNGGPGSSSMFGLFSESGPCEVVELGADRLETVAREWGWDRASNMLFIDQPNQVGFSYDVPTNGTLDLVNGNAFTPPERRPATRPLGTFLNGTFSSMNVSDTANTTVVAAEAIWHMLQGFLGAFPQYYPPRNSSVGVNLFAESYGGKYGPVFADTWETQNARRRNGTLSNSTLDIHLTALGIVNGCVDDLIQGPSYAAMAVNNTYGLQTIKPLQASLMNASFYAPKGCQDQIKQCRTAADLLDPENDGDVDTVNYICANATTTCGTQLLDPYVSSFRSYYDISHLLPDSYPPSQYITYLNSRPVQNAIGAVINFTSSSAQVYGAFQSTGDWERGPISPKLASLLNRGVRVGLIYGDRDYICNWLGGEAVSLEVASLAGGDYATRFPAAGYAPVIVNDSYIGGVVRQFGNLSFTRVYQAGHFVPASQPETAFQIFARLIMGTSVSTGEVADLTKYNTTGPLNATSSLSLPPSPTSTCYLRALGDSCDSDAVQSILQGEGFIMNEVWYPNSSNWPGATVTASLVGQSATTTGAASLTGVFTATATPNAGLSIGVPGGGRMLVGMGGAAAWLALAFS
jgi:carboxypeptidase C (cathepsin A)